MTGDGPGVREIGLKKFSDIKTGSSAAVTNLDGCCWSVGTSEWWGCLLLTHSYQNILTRVVSAAFSTVRERPKGKGRKRNMTWAENTLTQRSAGTGPPQSPYIVSIHAYIYICVCVQIVYFTYKVGS